MHHVEFHLPNNPDREGDYVIQCIIDGRRYPERDFRTPSRQDAESRYDELSKELQEWMKTKEGPPPMPDGRLSFTATNTKGETMRFTLNRRRNEYGEFVIRCHQNGERYPDGDYHTDDWDDAVKTLEAMNARIASLNKATAV